jgi:hypothetical protein
MPKGVYVRTRKIRLILSLAHLGKPTKPCSVAKKRAISNALKGHAVSPSTRRKISKANKGRTLGAEALRNMSIAQLNRDRTSLSEQRRVEKIRSATLLNWRNPTKKMLSSVGRSLGQRKSYAEGRRVPPASKGNLHEHGWLTTKKGGRFFYRSSWERLFTELIDSSSLVKKFSYQPFRLPYKLDGKTHTYFPDFLLEFKDGRRFLVELKGGREEERVVRAKKRSAVAFCRRNSIEFRLFRSKPSNLLEMAA